MAEDFHIDMSGRIYKRKTIGIACVGAHSKKHNGCALKGNLIKYIQRNLCRDSIKKEHAKIYAICIYFLITDKQGEINNLIICNDEDFHSVKEYLVTLLGCEPSFPILSISDVRKQLGRKVGSLADNYAKSYRKKALKNVKWKRGKDLDIVDITYTKIKEKWEMLHRKSEDDLPNQSSA